MIAPAVKSEFNEVFEKAKVFIESDDPFDLKTYFLFGLILLLQS